MSSLQLRAWRNILPAATVNAAVGTSSSFIDLSAITPGVCAIRVANVGANVIFIEQVEAAATAASVTTSVPILPNTVEVFTFPNDKIGVAVIAAATGNTVYITPGEGL